MWFTLISHSRLHNKEHNIQNRSNITETNSWAQYTYQRLDGWLLRQCVCDVGLCPLGWCFPWAVSASPCTAQTTCPAPSLTPWLWALEVGPFPGNSGCWPSMRQSGRPCVYPHAAHETCTGQGRNRKWGSQGITEYTGQLGRAWQGCQRAAKSINEIPRMLFHL